jgi:nitrate/TMAO reductase-like tetraheme cytochrome c subunit
MDEQTNADEQRVVTDPAPVDNPAAVTDPAAVDEDKTAPGPALNKRGKPKRSARFKWIVGVSSFFALIVILVIAAYVTAHFTSRSPFCNSCHEMNPYYSSWQDSTHNSAECRDCHIPPGTTPYIKTKLGSLREIWVHITKNPEAPLAVTRQIPNASCARCHSAPPTNPKLYTVAFSHVTHNTLDCVGCHKRLVHRTLPPGYTDPAAMSSCLTCHDGAVAPSACTTCHTAPHEVRGECSTCHSTTDFSGAGANHPFALTGSHADLTCTQCHVTKPGAAIIPGTQLAKADPACNSCHEDQHGGLTVCSGCHTPTAWKNVDFEHPLALTGGHAGLACAKCHVSTPGGPTVDGTTFPKPDPACISCHGDNHRGLTDCARCHTPQGWSPANFTHPNVGEHGTGAGIECGRCHPNGNFATHSCTCHGGNPPSGG